MKKKRFSVEQITAVLKQAEAGAPVGDLCRQVGISEQTFYRWKKSYGGMLPSEARETQAASRRECATEARRRRSDLGQGHAPGRGSKKVQKPVRQREVVHYLMGRYQVSERRATRAARLCLSSIRYQSCRDPLTVLRQQMRELAQTRVRFGYRRLLVLLRREG